MKRILLILLTLILLIPAVIAQTSECDTPDISEADYMALPWYGDEDDSFLNNFYDSLEATMSNPNPLARGVVEDVWYRIPIHFWIYQISSTNPGGIDRLPTTVDIQILMDAANKAARDNGIKVQFYLDCYEFINNANGITVEGYDEERDLALPNRRAGAINVHIVDNLSGAAGKFDARYNAIFIKRDVSFNDVDATTFPHELGHYFGLLHTHQFNEWAWNLLCLREPVTRGYRVTACPPVPGLPSKRCKWTGDLLCDTPADPNMGGDTPSAQQPDQNDCNYILGEQDQYGETYKPDEHNYMAYGNRGCRNNFSDGQIKWMYWWLTHVQIGQSSGTTWSTINNNTAFDIYEPDNNDITAREITIGEVQEHTFYDAASGICDDNKDWLRFKYPTTGTNYDLQLQIHNGSSVGEVKVYLRDEDDGTIDTQLTNLSETVVSGVRLITLACTSLNPGDEYLVEISRNQSVIGNYEVGLIELGIPPSVTGPDLICSTNSVITLNNPPAGAYVTWVATPSNFFVTSSGTGVTANLQASSSVVYGDDASVIFTVYSSCGAVPVSKSVWVGAPPPAHTSPIYVNGFYGQNPISLAQGGLYDFIYQPIQGANSYNWEVPPGFSISSGQGSYTTQIWTATTNGTHIIKCFPINGCGFSGYQSIYVNLGGGSGGPGEPECPFLPCQVPIPNIVYPNPTDQSFSVSVSDVGATELKLYNEKQELFYSIKPKTEATIIPVSNLPQGTYYLNIASKEGVIQRKIVVKH